MTARRNTVDVRRAKALASIEAALAGPLAPRPTQGGVAATAAIRRAMRLAGMVRDEGPDTIGAYLDPLTPDQLYALTVTLAAMVDVDRTEEELLGWLQPIGRDLENAAEAARKAVSRAERAA